MYVFLYALHGVVICNNQFKLCYWLPVTVSFVLSVAGPHDCKSVGKIKKKRYFVVVCLLLLLLLLLKL